MRFLHDLAEAPGGPTHNVTAYTMVMRDSVKAGVMSKRAVTVVHPLPIRLLVCIVNEWGEAPRIAAHEGTKPYPEVAAFRAERPEFWSHFPPLDEESLIKTANLVHPLFASTSGEECAERLNDVIARAGMTPALTSEGWSVQEVWHVSRPDSELLAGAVLSLMNHLRHEPDASRLGTCEGQACVDVYVDQSPAGRRQYCSLTCQNRNRTRAYRANRRAAGRS